MNRYLILGLICFMALSVSIVCFSQEKKTEEDMEYSYGTVIKVDSSKNEIVISEYDYDSDSDIIVTYSVDPKVKLEGVKSLKEIKPDDYADIGYIEKEAGKKVAKVISIYESE